MSEKTTRPKTDQRASSPHPILVAALGAGTLILLLSRYVTSGFRFPIGPDAPVYLWWTRLAGAESLASIPRPGVPALTLVMSGAFGRLPILVLGSLGGVLAAATGLACADLSARATFPRQKAGFLVGGVLGGAFAVHLAGGYFANLAYAAMFIVAASLIAAGGRRQTVLAAALIGAAGLAHPLFSIVGGAILLVTAFLARAVRDVPTGRFVDQEPGRILAALAGGLLFTGASRVVLSYGQGVPDAPTSQDAYLRRAGLEKALGQEYVARFRRHVVRYVPFVSAPLAVWGVLRASGFVGRFLRAWGIVLVLGVVVGLATQAFPPERFLTFGYVLPIGMTVAGLDLVFQAQGRTRMVLAGAACAVGVLMVVAAGVTWSGQPPFIDEDLAREATAAANAALLLPGRTIMFAANAPGRGAGHAASHDGNVFRAAMPADRIRDVFVSVGSSDLVLDGPHLTGDSEHDALSQTTWDELQALDKDVALMIPARVEGAGTTPPVAGEPYVLGLDAASTPLPSGHDPLAPQKPIDFVLMGLVALIMVVAAGWGWAWFATGAAGRALCLAPTMGLAALMLAGFILDRVGIDIGTGAGPWLVVLLAATPGLALVFRERRAVAQTLPEVEQQPDQ